MSPRPFADESGGAGAAAGRADARDDSDGAPPLSPAYVKVVAKGEAAAKEGARSSSARSVPRLLVVEEETVVLNNPEMAAATAEAAYVVEEPDTPR